MYNYANLPEDIIQTVFKQRDEFILIGLTGQIGSGCSEARRILTSNLSALPEIYPPAEGESFLSNEKRDEYIIKRYAEVHWKPFTEIRVRDLLTSFVLEHYEEFLTFLKEYRQVENVVSAVNKLDKDFRYFCKQPSSGQNFDSITDTEDSPCLADILNIKYGYTIANPSLELVLAQNKHLWDYTHVSDVSTLLEGDYYFLLKVLPEVSQKLADLLGKFGDKKINIYTQVYQDVGNIVRTYGVFTNNANATQEKEAVYAVAKRINRAIKIHRSANELRKRANDSPYLTEMNSCSETPVHIVIDSIKNPFEASYLKDRYSAFYLFAISANEDLRRRRCADKRRMSIEQLDYREHPSAARKGIREYKERQKTQAGASSLKSTLGEDLVAHYDYIFHDSPTISRTIWETAYQDNTYLFKLQDVEGCIQIADVFINNSFSLGDLAKSLIRYSVLMMHPGLVQPTPDERCMQLAQMAKLNSGCISRQVGAVVCDSDSNILAVNWNSPSSVPGTECISCSKRSFGSLLQKVDVNAYSTYEYEDTKFRTRIDDIASKERIVDGEPGKKEHWEFSEYGEPTSDQLLRQLNGLPLVYCFKDLYNDLQKANNQVHTRSQHAEERALESCNRHTTIGGTLYTTSNSCELCAKKAINYGISRIVYIEPYFGITETHVLGQPQTRSQLTVELFTGACQRAYIQMYTPIFPLKDELKLRGISYTTEANPTPTPNSSPMANKTQPHSLPIYCEYGYHIPYG
jgi:deoxycytidylate deaminase